MREYTISTISQVYNKKSGAKTESDLGLKEINSEKTYYYKQNKDLAFDLYLECITEEFSGNYDGSGHKLNLTATKTRDLIVSANQTTYSKSVSLFDHVSEDGVIKNLVICMDLDYKSQETNTIISGLALVNYGRIENIISENLNLEFIDPLTSNKIFAISTIVGINNGYIANSKNTAEINILNSKTGQSDATFSLAGIALINNKSLFNCSNQANISIEISSSSNLKVRTAGVVLHNEGSLTLCYNIADITVVNDRGVSEIGGLVGVSKNGSISYSFNTGYIKGDSFSGGIVYDLNSTAISNVLAYGKVNGGINNVFFAEATLKSVTNCYTYANYVDQFGMGNIIGKEENFEILYSSEQYKIKVDYISDSKTYIVSVESIYM